MSRESRKRQRQAVTGPKPAPRRKYPLTAAVLLALTAVVVVAIWVNRSPRATRAQDTPQVNGTASNAPATTAAESPFERLVGRWQRPDGGYILAIQHAADNGVLEAAYYNPNPIHVAKAEASREGSVLKVFIELRDVNYPGSTYTLTYEPASDQLEGIYFQAVQQQRYEIFFERLK